MIPIWVQWTEFHATAQGRWLKIVPCENCSTEYVYVLERQTEGEEPVFTMNVKGVLRATQ